MVTDMASSYATLSIGNFWARSPGRSLQPIPTTTTPPPPPSSPVIWWRYIDDKFLLWTHGKNKLTVFINYLNSWHPINKFTSCSSSSEIPLLDVRVLLVNGTLESDLYVKPTDKHQYLLKSSSSTLEWIVILKYECPIKNNILYPW